MISSKWWWWQQLCEILFFSFIFSEVAISKPQDPPGSIENNQEADEKSKFDIIEDNAGDDGDFIDDDFGLSFQREWEDLKQQRQRIEEEVRTHNSSWYGCNYSVEIAEILSHSVVMSQIYPHLKKFSWNQFTV